MRQLVLHAHNHNMPLRMSGNGEVAAVSATAVVQTITNYEILDSLPTPIAVIERNLSFVHRNSAWKEEFPTDPISDLPFSAQLIATLDQGPTLITEFRFAETARYFHIQIAPQNQGWIVTARSIGGEIQSETSALSQADWYRRALQAAGEGTWELDVESGQCWISPSLKEKLGFRAWDPVSTDQILSKIHPDDLDRYLHRRQRAIDGEVPLHSEIRLLTPAGDRWSLVSGAVLRDADGRAIRMAGMVVDVHERMMIEEQLRELNRALESKVADRTRELAQTNEELQGFCYSVSHDLRGPLRSINGFGKALEEDYGHMFDEQGRDYLKRIRKAAIRLSGLIDGLLNLARITQAGMRREPLNIGEIARELLDDITKTHPDRKATITIRPGLKTYGDLNLVRLALANLVENSWKFSSKCEVTKIEVGQEGDAFFVRDHGAGFNMEYASKLFAPFERLHTEAEFPGTGLGLAVVQRVIQRHHGTVWAEGCPGKGATVFFTLPARRRDRKAISTP